MRIEKRTVNKSEQVDHYIITSLHHYMMTMIFCFTAFFLANFGGFTDRVMDINMDGWTDRPPIIEM